MTERPYDLVLYGASGFVGKQTVRYLASHVFPKPLRWAIAGRNRQKLEAVRDEVGVTVDLLVADSQDQPAIDAIASQTRVLLSTAGPFAIHGNALIDACIRFRTQYVDITGETPWVRTLLDRYHAQAVADGTRSLSRSQIGQERGSVRLNTLKISHDNLPLSIIYNTGLD